MALINDKFATIKQLINDHHPNQAKDECDNGINNECVNAKGDFNNLKGKFADGGADPQLIDDLNTAIVNYFG